MDIENMIGKKVTYKGKNYIIDGHMTNKDSNGIDVIYFRLKLVKGKENTTYYVNFKSFGGPLTSTDDIELLNFISQCRNEYDIKFSVVLKEMEMKRKQEELQRIEQEKEEQKRHLIFVEEQKKLGTTRGKEDAREKVNTLYKVFTSNSYRDVEKASRFIKEFRDNYIIAFEDEKKVMKQEKLLRTRALNNVLDSYPGDLDELINWMKTHLLRIDVYASPEKLDNEQSAIDVVNKRDNTNYEVKIRLGQYVAYEAMFKEPQSAPKEFLMWEVSKHDYRTSDLNARVMEHPMNIKTGKMTCNALIKELVYSDDYAFNVGKYLTK